MTLLFNDKFNVIQKIEIEEDFDYRSQIINFFENYLESEISILHPEYLYQLFINNKFENIDELIINIFKNHLKKIKVNIKNLIKKDDYSIENGINKLLVNYIHKISYIYNIFKIDKDQYYNLFHNIILSDQIFILFIENEIASLTKQNNSKDIELLIKNIKSININNDSNYIWFLKLIGIIMRNNLPEIKENIIMKQSYEIKVIINYILHLKKFFNFIKETEYIIEPLNEIYIEKICNLLVDENNFDEFYYLIDNKWNQVNSILSSDNLTKVIKSEISLKINKYIKKIKGDYNEIYKVLKIIITLNEYNLIEPQIFLLFNNPKIYDNLLPFINNNINDIKLISKLMLTLNHLKEKDLFIKQYHHELIKRLLSNKSNSVNENILIVLLVKFFGEKECKKLLKCIEDYDNSIKALSNYYKNDEIRIIDQKMITTSYDSWNIDFNNGYISSHLFDVTDDRNKLLKYMNDYSKYYKSEINNRKKLVWLVHFGEIEIQYLKYEIKLFPIQLLMLEVIETHDPLTIEQLKNTYLFQNYQNEYLDNIIKSLEICGLLKNINNKLQLSDTIFETNLIQVYYSCVNNLIRTDTKNFQNELAHSRREIICTLINHLLKKGDKNYNDLFKLISSDIKLFQVDENLLNIALEYMINQDYISKINDEYKKIYY
jgi:hypothetical protein